MDKIINIDQIAALLWKDFLIRIRQPVSIFNYYPLTNCFHDYRYNYYKVFILHLSTYIYNLKIKIDL